MLCCVASPADSAIVVIPEEPRAVEAALASCRAGDLLVVFGDQISRCWKQITKFRSEGPAMPAPTSEAAVVASAPIRTNDGALEDHRRLGGVLVEDERGVRIVREAED